MADALGLRDGFAKAIYSKTFAWIVRTINTDPDPNPTIPDPNPNL